MAPDANGRVDPFSRKLDYLCSEVVRALKAIETLQRRFFPPKIPSLQEEMRPLLPSLDQARRDTRKIEPSRGFEGVRDTLDRSAGLVVEALELITTSSRSDMEKTVIQVLQGLRKSCRAQEQLFPLRRALPTIDRFFLEPEVRDRASELDPEPPPRRIVLISVDTLRRGRRSHALALRMEQEGKPILAGQAWAVDAGMKGFEHDFAQAPDVPAADRLKSFSELADDYDQWYPLWQTVEGKPVEWRQGPSDPTWHCWMRLNETPALHADPWLDAARTAMWMDLMMWKYVMIVVVLV